MLTQRSHVIVITEGDTQISGSFTDFGDQTAQAFVIGGNDCAVLWFLVGYLKIRSADVVYKFRMSSMLGDFIGFWLVNPHATAGERHDLELMFLQQVF